MIARARIPNLLTFARVAAVPLCLALMLFHPAPQPALFVIFVLASLTDFLDGHLARKWNATSAIGTLLDPVADKLLVALVLVYLAVDSRGALFLPAVVIILRELYISGLREFLAARQIALPVSRSGKWKTAMQMTGIGLVLGALTVVGPLLMKLGTLLIWLSAVLALTSAVDYTRAAWRSLR